MNYQEIRALLLANKHDHALQAVSRIRFRMLESQLARAVEARRTAERKLHEHVCDEHDELNRARAENRRLQRELGVLRQALSLAAPGTVPQAQRPGSKRLPRKSASAIRNSELVLRALRGEPLPEPPEPGTFDPTIDEEEAHHAVDR